MKKLLLAVVSFLICLSALGYSYAQETKELAAFNIYTDKIAKDNHYVPSGWMGDYGDIKMDDQSMDEPQSGNTCIKFEYTAKKTQNQGWAGVFWQNPANNWGSKKGGFDLTGYNKLTFWARGKEGAEVIEKFKIGGITGAFPDTAEVEAGPFELAKTWKEFTINLSGKDLTYISGGFCWVINANANPSGATFYVDNVKFEFDASLKPEAKKVFDVPFYVYSDAASVANHFIPSGWMGDYGDIKLDAANKEEPYLGDTCVKIVYNAQATQGARWCGIYWQNPANNWGNVDGGLDLSKATKITFWAKGAKGGERIEEFKMGGIMGEYFDSDTAGIGPVVLTKEWQKYTIDLKGKDLSYVIGGFCWATNMDVNPEGATFYLDEIVYE